MTSIPLSELESSAAAKFENINDAHVGRIVGIVQRPQTDLKSGQVKTFSDGARSRCAWAIDASSSGTRSPPLRLDLAEGRGTPGTYRDAGLALCQPRAHMLWVKPSQPLRRSTR